MERQRQDIKSALYQMTVWNSFSPSIVQQICDSKANTGRKRTIDEMVRVHAAKTHHQKNGKMRRTNSVELAPIQQTPRRSNADASNGTQNFRTKEASDKNSNQMESVHSEEEI